MSIILRLSCNRIKIENIITKVYRQVTVDEPFCPQSVSAFSHGFKCEPQCLIWSYWYIWLTVNNPSVPSDAINRYMVKMTPEEAYDRVTRIATIAFGSVHYQVEPEVFAIYSRTGTKKILALINYKTGEVTYTPFGIEFLKVNITNLPSYIHLIDITNTDDYVSIPYVKGHSKLELERLIAEKAASKIRL